MGCTRQVMHRVAIQRSETLMVDVSIYYPIIFVCLDEVIRGTFCTNTDTVYVAFWSVTIAC